MIIIGSPASCPRPNMAQCLHALAYQRQIDLTKDLEQGKSGGTMLIHSMAMGSLCKSEASAAGGTPPGKDTSYLCASALPFSIGAMK